MSKIYILQIAFTDKQEAENTTAVLHDMVHAFDISHDEPTLVEMEADVQ